MLQFSLFDDYEAPAIPATVGTARVGLRPNSKVLAVPRGMAKSFDYTLNPYVGCAFGCAYCYAANFIADEGLKADWGKWVDVKIDAVEQIARAHLTGKRVLMSSATDPYQPLEERIRLTRQILEALVKRQPVLTVQTRSPLVRRDIDLLAQFEHVCVSMSVTTDSDEIRKRFEPSCPSIERRLEALAEVSRAGIPVRVCLSPMLPIENPKRFAERILEVRPACVVSSFFHLSDRKFSSTTRDPAIGLLKEFKWTRERYNSTLRELCRHLPMLKPWAEADFPRRFSEMRRSA